MQYYTNVTCGGQPYAAGAGTRKAVGKAELFRPVTVVQTSDKEEMYLLLVSAASILRFTEADFLFLLFLLFTFIFD